MVARVEAMSATDPKIFAARHQRVAAGSPSPEHSKIKLDPRIAAFVISAALVALGVISLARPTIDSVASVDVLAHPTYSPAPAALSAEPALTIASCPSPTEPTKSTATPTEIVEKPREAVYTCTYRSYGVADDCSGKVLSEGEYQSTVTYEGCNTYESRSCEEVSWIPCNRSQYLTGCTQTGTQPRR